MEKPVETIKDFALGKHLTAEFYDCSSEILADAHLMESIFIASAKASGATVLGSNFHDFKPQGVSGFVIIAESHFSVHAWPEYDYAAVDIFTCGESIDFRIAVESLKSALKSESVIISGVMNRGIVGNNGVERLVPVYVDKTQAYALAWQTRFNSVDAWGLQCSLDIHDCSESFMRDRHAVESGIYALCGELSLEYDGSVEIREFHNPDKGDGLLFHLPLAGGGRISGDIAWDTHSAYVDIFSTSFIEPRSAAEKALAAFHGRHYRMQVAVRR